MSWTDYVPVVGTAVDYFSAQDANRRNSHIAADNREANARQAQLQRDWEERMSSTSYQRAIADMKKAGVNPMLLFSKGVGASTPTGASASSNSPGNPIQPFKGAASAKEALMLKSQLENLAAQTRKTNADAEITELRTPKERVESRVYQEADKIVGGVLESGFWHRAPASMRTSAFSNVLKRNR